ncbi:MAG: EAL domain-containing protein [Kangiellaceae bacterium]|nr:EAL domain-containing protein [Kangiellaceae bacterium]
MIRKNILQVMIAIASVFIVLLYLITTLLSQNFHQNTTQQINKFSVITSQVDRITEKYSIDNQVERDELLSQINLIPETQMWQLTGSEGEVIASYSKLTSTEGRLMVSKIFYLPQAIASTSEFTLAVHFSLEQITIFSTLFIQKILLAATVLLIFLGWIMSSVFAWVGRLESYSKLVLTTDDNRMINSSLRFHNIIGHAINQLILNNTYLVKSKSELSSQIRRTTYIDDVTELGNHLFFKAELQVRLHNQGEAESGLVIILSFLESHVESDALTHDRQVQIAEYLKGVADPIENSIVAKLKDSEFVLLLPKCTAEQTDRFCKKIIKDLSFSVFSQPEQVHHFVDIGISTYKQGFDYYHVMAEADLALRNSQLQGANNWYMYGEPLSPNKSKGSLRWRSFLRSVLDQRHISLYTQKLVYFNTGENLPKQVSNPQVVHHEILARIQDGEDTLSAETFLAMAHQCGLSIEFDRQIVSSVIQHILYSDFSQNNHLTAINILVPSLLDKTFSDWLIGKISSYPSLASHLVLEVSEVLLSKNIERVAPIMHQLSHLGIKWCIEHFCTIGEDQFYLDKIPFHMVKIDRRIVNRLAEEPSQQLLFNAIIVSLKDRGVAIFAEGVEKQADANFIMNSDATGAQGYLYHRPELLVSERKERVVNG